MIDWKAIKREEKAALTAYARSRGVSAEAYARETLKALRNNLKRYNRTHTNLGGKPIGRLPLIPHASAVDALLSLRQRANRSQVKGLAELISRHLNRYGNLYPINMASLRERARGAGVQPGVGDWIADYLGRVPIVTPFTPDIEAFVYLFPRGTAKVIVSAHLFEMIEVALIPLTLNMLSEDGKFYPLRPRELSDEHLALAKDVIIAMLQTYTHEKETALKDLLISRGPDIWWVLRRTELCDTIGSLLTIGAMDFVYLHELAHVVLAHGDIEPKREEHEADNLAINCLIHSHRDQFEDDFISSFAAAGAVIVLCFIEALSAFYGFQKSMTHPPPVSRMVAVAKSILGGLAKGALINYQYIALRTLFLFQYALKQQPEGSLDDDMA